MHNRFITSSIIALMLTGSAAYADQIVGTIKAMDQANNTVVLENGTEYSLADVDAKGSELDGYRVGDKVIITYDDAEGAIRNALQMSPDYSDSVTGDIASIDEPNKTVTLADGQTYKFQDARPGDVGLSGFDVGDRVSIATKGDGIATTISGHAPAEVVGEVRSVDLGTDTMTLEDGNVYHFDDKTDLSGYKKGDRVKISGYSAGGTHIGETLNPA